MGFLWPGVSLEFQLAYRVWFAYSLISYLHWSSVMFTVLSLTSRWEYANRYLASQNAVAFANQFIVVNFSIPAIFWISSVEFWRNWSCFVQDILLLILYTRHITLYNTYQLDILLDKSLVLIFVRVWNCVHVPRVCS